MFHSNNLSWSYNLRQVVLNKGFPFLLGIILFIIYVISFDSVILCDDGLNSTACISQESVQETLDKLKSNLSYEVKAYKEACDTYGFWRDGKSRAINESGSTNYKLWSYLSDQSIDSLKICNKILKNIRSIEGSIKNIDPHFISSLEKQGYENIVFKYTDY